MNLKVNSFYYHSRCCFITALASEEIMINTCLNPVKIFQHEKRSNALCVIILSRNIGVIFMTHALTNKWCFCWKQRDFLLRNTSGNTCPYNLPAKYRSAEVRGRRPWRQGYRKEIIWFRISPSYLISLNAWGGKSPLFSPTSVFIHLLIIFQHK